METVGEYEYELHERACLGHGAFGAVYKGRQRNNPDLPVAVKRIKKCQAHAKGQAALEKEMEILKKVKHDNVVRLLYYQKSDNDWCLVLEYCSGGDLAQYLQKKKLLSEDTLKLFVHQIANAMQAIHQLGIVHRDLKPANILLYHPGIVNPLPIQITFKLADFGLSRHLEESTMAITMCGSPLYMAPEVLMCEQYDAKCDLWSIGVIVYQCLTGVAPFEAKHPAVLKKKYKEKNLAPQFDDSVSPDLKHLLTYLLKREPRQRISFVGFFSHSFHAEKRNAPSSAPVPIQSLSTPARSGFHNSPSSIEDGFARVYASQAESPVMSADISEDLYHPSSYQPPSLCRRISHSTDLQIAPEETIHLLESMDAECDTEGFVMIEKPDVSQKARKQSMDDSPSGRLSGSSYDAATIPYQSHATQYIPVPTPHHPLLNPVFVQASPTTSPWKGSKSPDHSSPHSSPHGHSPPLSGPRSLPVHSGSPGREPGLVTKLFSRATGSPPMHQHCMPIHTAFATTGRMNVNISPTIYGQSVPHRCMGRRSYSQTGSPAQIRCISTKEHNNSLSPVLDKFMHRSKTEPCIAQFHGAQGMSPPMQPLETGFVSPHNVPTPSSLSPSPSRRYLVGTSPPNMQGPIVFNAPCLSEETIMNASQTETLRRLTFSHNYVTEIINVAQSRCSVIGNLMCSSSSQRSESSSVSDQLGTCISTGRVEEQLALYQLALELLSNALQLARREIESGKLMKSSSVRKIVKQLIELRSQSLDWYKKLLTVEFSSVRLPVPEKLVFMHAVELCQDCVDRETMMTDGSDTDCKAGYLRALLLLEGLLDNADNPCDRRLLTESKAVLEQHIHAGLPSQID